MLSKTDQVVISGRRQFRNGNTYHSTKVFVNSVLVGEKLNIYGYDDHWKQTGKEILIDKGYWPKTGERLNGCDKDEYLLGQYMIDNRNQFLFIVSDVHTEKELKQF